MTQPKPTFLSLSPHSLTLGQGGTFLHSFEVTASAAPWTPWQWTPGDSCWPGLQQQPLPFTWQWPCVLPGTPEGKPILLSPGLPPSMLLRACKRNRMVVERQRLLDHHYRLLALQLLNSAKGVRTSPQRGLGLLRKIRESQNSKCFSTAPPRPCCFEKSE